MHYLLEKKHTGILIPLFSMRSKKDWGIGDIKVMAEWFAVLREMKIDVLQILPINEMPPGTNCPYTALSAFAIDPLYIAVEEAQDLQECPEAAEKMKSKEFKDKLKKLRSSKTILYEEIKQTKFLILWDIYLSFRQNHVVKNTQRAQEFHEFSLANAYWLDDYAVFRRLKDSHGWTSWTHWQDSFKRHGRNTLEEFEKREKLQTDFFKYLQWIVHKQWQKAKESAQINGIKLFGDLPFMVNQESADVWSRQIEFDLTREIGAPPDAFSKTGQKWGLPAPDWAEMEKNNFEWWSMRIKKAACFYDIFRIDHMVGFFRTWIIPNDPRLAPDFDIKTAEYQKVRGKKFLQTAVSASPALPVAEDLGVIPPYVRETLRELNVPGYKVLRWEKESGEYIDTEKYLPVSLATTSTHDNEPLAQWWKIISAGEKRLFWKMISGRQETPPPFSKARSRIIKKLLESSSCLAVLPIQDIFGLKDRINIPNTVGSHNWSYRFAAPVENFLTKHAETIENFRKTVEEAGRG